MKRNPRFSALMILVQIETNQAYSNLLVHREMEKMSVSGKDKGLLTEIVYGTISRKLYLDFCLAPFIAKAKKVDTWVKTLLELSVYQLLFLDRVPDHAVLNDAVEIAKARGNEGIGKFVNGVLRNIQRKGVPSTETVADPLERLVLEISMPRWLVETLLEQLSMEEVKQLGLSLFTPSRVSARVNPKYISLDSAVAELLEEGIEVNRSSVSPYGVIGEKGFLAGSQLFEFGYLTIQDESSMLVAPAMQLEPQHQVLDACAAPGGKTTHIATYLDPSKGGKVTSLDIHEKKLTLIKENAERLHVEDVVETQLLDARKVNETFADETFDRILVDAPCSGLGLLRRKPDIKYSKAKKDLAALQKIQSEILESVASKLKVSGILTYSTCTITMEENDEVVELFLKNHPEYEKIEVLGSETVPLSVENQTVKIFPQQYNTDGFFICCLKRNAK